MARSAADRQRDFRIRQAKQIARVAMLEGTINRMVAALGDRDGEVSNEIRRIAREGLAG